MSLISKCVACIGAGRSLLMGQDALLFAKEILHASFRVPTHLEILEIFLNFILRVPCLEIYLNFVNKPGILSKIFEKNAFS